MSVDVVWDAGEGDAVDDVVADGDEAVGDIRIVGIKTTSSTASPTPAATTTYTPQQQHQHHHAHDRQPMARSQEIIWTASMLTCVQRPMSPLWRVSRPASHVRHVLDVPRPAELSRQSSKATRHHLAHCKPQSKSGFMRKRLPEPITCEGGMKGSLFLMKPVPL